MRGFIIAVLAVALGILFLRQKHNETAPPAAEKPAAVTAARATPPPPALTPAPRGQASEYNYMKRALDRARDVTEQSRARTQAAQDPQP